MYRLTALTHDQNLGAWRSGMLVPSHHNASGGSDITGRSKPRPKELTLTANMLSKYVRRASRPERNPAYCKTGCWHYPSGRMSYFGHQSTLGQRRWRWNRESSLAQSIWNFDWLVISSLAAAYILEIAIYVKISISINPRKCDFRFYMTALIHLPSAL